MNKNYVELAGVIANEVKVYSTKSGKEYCRFTVIVTEDKFSEYIRCVAWEKAAKAIGKLKKGDKVSVKGRIHNSSYESNGEKKYSTDVLIEEVE